MSTNQTKKCSKCKEIKPIELFYKNNHKKDGYQTWCKTCCNQYKINNKKSIKIQRKEYCIKNKDKISNYYENNKTKIRVYQRKYNKLYVKNRRKKDIGYRITGNLRSRVNSAIKNNYGEKAYKTKELIGCTIQFLLSYLESKFVDGMSWERIDEIHIDHIRPCASFDLTDPEEQKKCFHYTNLQPLWAKDNISKGNKWE